MAGRGDLTRLGPLAADIFLLVLLELALAELLEGPGVLGQCDHALLLSIDVPAPPQPGHYALKFDLVSEGIDWFERSGSETTLKALHVR